MPPLGACWAARRQVSRSASVTGSSVKRRIARVVMIVSIVASVVRRPLSALRTSPATGERRPRASAWSADRKHGISSAVDTSKLVSSACLSWAFTASFVPRTASGAPAASRRAHAIAALGTSSAGTTSAATPSRIAPRRGERVAQQQVALGGERAEQQRPDRGAAVAGDEADLDVGIDDHGVVGHHDTSHSSATDAPSPAAGAVERAHDRQLDVEQVPDDLLGLAPQCVRAASSRTQRREPRHVAAGRERPPGAGEHHRPRRGLALEEAEQLAEVVRAGGSSTAFIGDSG